MDKIIGIGDYAISNKIGDNIVTFALGSCVAVTVFCQERKAAGMAHIALPYPLSPEDAKERPFYYAATGVPLLLDKMCSEYSCKKRDLRIALFGGAEAQRKNDVFKIGQRNVSAIKKILDEMNLAYDDSKTGGIQSRTLRLEVHTGIVTVESQRMVI